MNFTERNDPAKVEKRHWATISGRFLVIDQVSMIYLGMSALVLSSALIAYATTCVLDGFFVAVGFFVIIGVPFAITFPPPGRIPEGIGAVFLLLEVALPAALILVGWTAGVCAGWRKRRA